MRGNSELNDQIILESAWRKSTRSGAGSGGDCVEVASLTGGRAIRDSKDTVAGELRVHEGPMTAFLAGVQGGAFGS